MKGEGYYEKELPEKFKTWVELLQFIRQNGFDKTHMEVIILQPKEVKIDVEGMQSGIPTPGFEAEEELRYLISTIKDKALDEIFSEEVDRKEFTDFTIKVRQALYWAGVYNKDEIMGKVVRTMQAVLGREKRWK